MLLASHLAGLGQASGTGVGAVHAIGHAIGTRGRLPTGRRSRQSCRRSSRRTSSVRERELAPRRGRARCRRPGGSTSRGGPRGGRRPRRACSAASASADASRRSASGPDLEALIVADAVDDAAIANSPRIPSADEIAGDPGGRQRRMNPGMSGSGPCQRSNSSVANDPKKLMKWPPRARITPTTARICLSPLGLTDSTTRPCRAAAS